MARNTLAGKGKSNNTEKTGRDYKKEYKDFQGSEKQKRYRAELNKANRDAGSYGNKDGKDMSHQKNGKLVKESQSKNRARQGRDGRSTKK
jgi:hypothetical protein